jgi:hypothetical protein
MPRNRYISHGTTSEKNLLAELIAESIQVYGHDVYYIPRKIIKLDRILNEDLMSNFPDAYMIEMYVESIDGFEGDGKLITKFGLEIRDQLSLVCSKYRWNQLVGRFGYPEESVRPVEGDLIYVPLTKGIFEIKYVDDKKPFFQLGGLPTYKFTVELYEYPNTFIDTGVEEIDEIQGYTSTGFGVLIEHEVSSTLRFVEGDYVTLTFPDDVTGSCKILHVERTADALVDDVYLSPITYDDGLYRALEVGTDVLNSISGAVGTITFVSTLENASDNVTNKNDDNAQNSQFESEGNSWVDFSEDNPFGNINL